MSTILAGVGTDLAAPHTDQTALSAAATLPPAIARTATEVLARAKTLVIACDAEYAQASAFGVDIRSERDLLEADRVRLKKPFLSGGQSVDDYFRAPLSTFNEAMEVVRQAMQTYNENKRKAAEKLRLEQEAAQRAAQAEAKRLEDEALASIRAQEKARLEAAEAESAAARAKAAQAEATARGAREEAEQAKKDAALEREAAIEARRKQLRAEASATAAIRSMEAANAVASTTVVAEVEKPKGTRTEWCWEVTDRAVVEDRWLTVDTAKVDMYVRRLKDQAGAHMGPGFKIYPKESVVLRK